MITGTRPVPVKRADRMIDDCYTTSRGHKVTRASAMEDISMQIARSGHLSAGPTTPGRLRAQAPSYCVAHKLPGAQVGGLEKLDHKASDLSMLLRASTSVVLK
jgi:hypothetical protein